MRMKKAPLKCPNRQVRPSLAEHRTTRQGGGEPVPVKRTSKKQSLRMCREERQNAHLLRALRQQKAFNSEHFGVAALSEA